MTVCRTRLELPLLPRGAGIPFRLALIALLASAPTTVSAQAADQAAVPGWAQDPPVVEALVSFGRGQSELRPVIEAYTSGRNAMRRSIRGEAADSPEAADRQRAWYESWLKELARVDFDALGTEAKVDYVLLRNGIAFELEMLAVPRAALRSGPIGAEGLRAHLAHEMIPYSAEELIAIANAEFAYLEGELLKASREMGYGDDWRAAQEAVKRLAVQPGEKPAVVRELAAQSEAFLDARASVTIPPLAREIWRMGMLSPERQLTSPFFLGGEQILISYPTDEMSHEDKLMSMRGNNPHFNRATVHHELIPGHHLQGFMNSRFNTHRSAFGTPFWTEGWALYWEIVLWEQGFPRGPEDRIGMLFWRMHRAARIIFSLSYHLGTMTEAEAVDFLVDRVGHERANAAAEVRRSFEGSYPPLYQVAYMMGGLQFRALRRELVESGRMTERAFHDAILLGGTMPVELVRARLTGGDELTPDYTTRWRFAGDPLGTRPNTQAASPSAAPAGDAAPSIEQLLRTAGDSDLRVALHRFNVDAAALRRRYDIPLSPVLHARQRAFLNGWNARLSELDTGDLNANGHDDLERLRERIVTGLDSIAVDEQLRAEITPLLPFLRTLQQLQEHRRERLDIEPMATAQTLADVLKEVRRLTAAVSSDDVPPSELSAVSAAAALRAAALIAPAPAGEERARPGALRAMLDDWFGYHNGYDPLFTWWAHRPYEELTAALDAYSSAIVQRWRPSI